MMALSAPRTRSLTNGLINRVRILGVLVGLTIGALLIASLFYAFQNAHASVVAVARDAAKLLDLYLSNTETDLLRVGRILPLTDEENRTAVLRDVLDTYGAVFQISFVAADGQVLVDRRRVGSSQTGIRIAQPWQTQTADGQTYFSDIDYSEFGVPTVTIAVPVYVDDGVDGSLVARLELTALWSLIVSIRAGDSGYACLIDDLGGMLAYRDNKSPSRTTMRPSMDNDL
ncbi:MAG: cache domain-containing protein [Chloroflexota bacterium]|nr:cache domain-containing protein [Chloroflexota bacterium]